MKTTARARVRVVIDVPAEGVWGDDCPVWQVHRQAREDVLCRLKIGAHKVGGSAWGGSIVGEPEVTIILTEES